MPTRVPTRRTVRVQFQTPDHAMTASKVLSVDDELSLKAVKELHVDSENGCMLVGHFRATDARVLRVMVSSFYDMLGVVIRTLRDFS